MRKRKKQQKKIIYVLMIFIIIVSLSIGYSLFGETLNISGSANTLVLISGPNLDINLIPNGSIYTSGTYPSKSIVFQNETLNNNELTVNYNRDNSTGKKYNISISINFTNKYHLNLTSGTASAQRISGTEISGLTSSLSKTTLIPNEQGSLTVNFGNTNKSGANLRITMSYGVNGITQSYYYNVIIV